MADVRVHATVGTVLLLLAPRGAFAADAALPKVLALRPASSELGSALAESRWFRSLSERLPSQGWRLEIGPRAAGALPAEVDVEFALLPASPELAGRLQGLPVEVDGPRVKLAGTTYSHPATLSAFRLPGGTCSTCQRWVVVGTDSREVASFAVQTALGAAGLGRRWGGSARAFDYLIRESPYIERSGRWLRSGEQWAVDPATDHDEIGERTAWFARLVPVAGSGTAVRLLVPPDRLRDPELGGLAAELERSAHAMAARIPLALEGPVTIALERDHATQGRHTGEVGPAVVGGPADLHLVWRPEDGFAYRVTLAEVLVARAGLARRTPWLAAGAALWLAEDWYGRPYREWLPRLVAAEVLPTAAELLANEEQEDSSRPLWTPVAAAVIDRLRGETLAAKLAVAPGEPVTRAILARFERSAAEPLAAARPTLPERFLAGVSFAHDNSLEGGYHAPGAGGQLDRLAALGADAVALMPFGYQREARKPQLGFQNRGAASENDAGMVHAARLAHEKGFAVLWKPHLWISFGSWPGDVEMDSEADWRAWWTSYRRFIVHHAMVAAWAGADLFSVGVELDRTVGRERDWTALIAAVRRFYPGPVTYAANWGEGAERVSFWHRLDAAGVDAYYPLAPPGTTEIDAAGLERGAREVVAKLAALAAKARLPLILTEVGFPARRGAWSDPHDEDGEPSAEDQERAYRALVPALQGQPWLRGAFFWKAFSGPRGEPSGRADFQFLGRPAERWVSAFWRSERLRGEELGPVSGSW